MAFVPPTAGVFDAPAVSISLNQEWRSFVLGALGSLISSPEYGLSLNGVYAAKPNPVWSGDDDAVYAADQEIEKLLNVLVKGMDMTITGIVEMYVGAVAPTGWLLCDGAEYLRTDYPFLYERLPAAYHIDADNFNVPDLRGRVPVGAGTGDGLTPRVIGSADGEENHVLTIPELPAHAHSIQAADGTTAFSTDFFALGNAPYGWQSGYATENAGEDQSHNNMPPFAVLNFIIKT